MTSPPDMDPAAFGELPSPWKRRLEKTAEQAYVSGVWRGFKMGVWFCVAAWFVTFGLWWVYATLTQG